MSSRLSSGAVKLPEILTNSSESELSLAGIRFAWGVGIRPHRPKPVRPAKSGPGSQAIAKVRKQSVVDARKEEE